MGGKGLEARGGSFSYDAAPREHVLVTILTNPPASFLLFRFVQSRDSLSIYGPYYHVVIILLLRTRRMQSRRC